MSSTPGKASSDGVRAFVALPLPEGAASQLENMQKQLLVAAGPAHANLRLTPRHQFHVTLAFLGEINEARVSVVIEAVSGWVRSCHGPFRLSPDGFVFFPSARRARVIGLSLSDSSGELAGSVAELHGRLRSLRFDIEKREFRPHVTLARLKQPAQIHLPDDCHVLSAQDCSTVAVYRSRLRAAGSRYEILHETTL